MTRIALPVWEGRLSPVFDVAEHLLLVDVEDTQESGRQVHRLLNLEPKARARTLAAHDVDVLICGAISRVMAHALSAAGIEVVSGICGDVGRVLEAFSLGNLDSASTLHLPGTQRHSPAGPEATTRARVHR